MKNKIAVAIAVVVVVLLMFFLLKPDSLEDKVSDLSEDLTSYYLEGNMEITNQEDYKNYLITSSWMKDGDKEYFKVSMIDKALNQEQIILKNDDGVFVITPSLNQVFKFQGEWPLNSPKPYLLQTMFDIINAECEISSENGGYLIEADANYPSSPTLVRQEIRMTSELKPVSLVAYNSDDQIGLQMDFSVVNYDEVFPDGTFDTPKSSIETPTSSYTGLIELPLYPMAVFDSKLTSSTVSVQDGSESHVMEFSGDKEFTVVQSEAVNAEELVIEEIEGELVEGLGMIGYYNGNKLTVFSSQLETSVYSQDLSVNEMLQVVESMQVSVMK